MFCCGTAYRAAFGRALADWPAEIREPLLEQGFSGEGFRQSLREPMNVPRLFGEVRDAGHSGIAWFRPDAVVRAIRDVLSR